MSLVDRARKRVKMQPAPAEGGSVQTNLQRLVGVGDAYHDLDAETGLRALWRLALPDDAVSWLEALPVGSVGLNKAASAFADVWWIYTKTFLYDVASSVMGAGVGKTTAAPTALRFSALVELAAHKMARSAKMRGRFQALLFQVVVSDRHDQSTSYILGDPSEPFSHYVSRSKIGALFSLRALVSLEKDYVPAARAVGLFRKSSGKNPVAHQRAADGLQLEIPLRKRLFVYHCAQCAGRKGRAQFHCPRCGGRMKEGDPKELVRVWGSQRAHVPKPDAWTVLADVEAKPAWAPSKKKNKLMSALALKVGDVIPVHGPSGREDWRVTALGVRPCVQKITAFAAWKGFKREFEYDKTETVLTLSQNVCVGKTKRKGVVRMLKEHPELLHEATLSVHLDKHLKHRAAFASAVEWATDPVYVRTKEDGGVLDESELKRYLVWRCAVGMVLAVEPELEQRLSETRFCRLTSSGKATRAWA